jgi:cytochrome b
VTGEIPVAARVHVWDLPTRLVHWLMVLLIGTLWWTGETGRLEWHRWAGYSLLALVLFRVYWGVFGSSTARFSQFVRGPRGVVRYLRGEWTVTAGHNPLGALSVVALLALVLTQILLGLFAVDVDGIESGPLSHLVSFDTGRDAAELHETVFNVLLTVIVLHVVAVFFYLLARRQNLIGAMFTGRRSFAAPVEPLTPASWPRLITGIAIAAAITWAIVR